MRIVPDWLKAQQDQFTQQNRGIAGIDPSATPTGLNPQDLERLRFNALRPQATPSASVGLGNLRGPFANMLGNRIGGLLQRQRQSNLASLLGGTTMPQPSNSLAALQERMAKLRGVY